MMQKRKRPYAYRVFHPRQCQPCGGYGAFDGPDGVDIICPFCMGGEILLERISYPQRRYYSA